MPYIEQKYRDKLDPLIYKLLSYIEGNEMGEGALNYTITKLCKGFAPPFICRYAEYNTVMGVLECVKQEYYRRAIVPYEEKKAKENGDVY